ncbi:NADH-quinone oxidoreductase subunit F [Taibaiella sp. KBW10]|uniref:NADH-quinone oxidoreductase subunit N n=1 Tax=Taibaiella sp. KBW10 TaxID=2153357 RepID=UPI000F5AEE6A|nr:NADH-quinone oxidoreductase subunit N [Taibaiella sp. KBW10]RQO31680.1 NADH-quinone oxidoreductase subunit F [Taibaiella sp. KBW10]
MKPLIATAVFAILMMFAALTVKEKKSLTNFAAILMLGLIGLNIWELADYNHLLANAQAAPDLFAKMLRVDNYALWFNVLMTACSFLYILLTGRSIEKVGVHVGEYYSLHFFILCGVFLLSTYNNLLILFLGIEILSIPQYILAGSDKRNLKSSEAALKYFLMGAFSTGILLMGIVLLYGAMGTFDIHGFNFYATGTLSVMGIVGVMFMLVALGFKVSAAPMHFWTPDVYDGSPTPFTAFMATIVKVSVFFAFMRLFMEGFANIDPYWKVLLLGVITGLTLLIGNITAVYQQSVKRMLAYSSIAQAGFMMFVVIGSNAMAMKGMIVYAVAYTIATLGIFGVLLKLKDYTYDGFNGLAKKHPFLALVATICLMSLAGIPLTAGFFAKWFVIAAALEQAYTFWLVVFALVMAAVSLFYYFKVIMAMYFKQGDPELVSEITTLDKVVMTVIICAIIVFGIAPDMLLSWI